MGATPLTLLNLVLEKGGWKGAGRWTKGQFLNITIDNIDFTAGIFDEWEGKGWDRELWQSTELQKLT